MSLFLSYYKTNLQLGREVLDEAAKVVKVGVTTDEIDRVVHEVGFE
jgi:methionyl aminopeptidase